VSSPSSKALSFALLIGQQRLELFLIGYETSDPIAQLVTRHGILAVGEEKRIVAESFRSRQVCTGVLQLTGQRAVVSR
jgi:hypothetical protein